MGTSPNDDIIILEEILPQLSSKSTSPTKIIIVSIVALTVSSLITREQPAFVTLAVTPFLAVIIWYTFTIFIQYSNFATKLSPIRATIDKNTGIMTIDQISPMYSGKTKVNINELANITTYGNRFYYPEMTNGLFNTQAPDSVLTTGCGINFNLTSGKTISVNTNNDSYTGAYKALADRIGEVLKIPVDK